MDACRDRAGRARSADLLAEAGGALVGNPLPEWSARLDALRALLRPRAREALAAVHAQRKELGRRLPSDARRALLGGGYWKAWTRKPAALTAGEGESPPARAEHQGAPRADPGAVSTRTVALAGARSRLVVRSAGMQKLVGILDRLRGNEIPVLIQGETGTGKELVARVIHEESSRAAGPFRVVDCATIPSGLLESELFGARAGAFTGIERDRTGILAQADGGTILIDEIGGVEPEVQGKLLRVLDSGGFRPVGAEEEIKVDARFLFSTSRDLEGEVKEGLFRRDLYHRIRVLALEVPPLRDRPEDFEDLARRLLSEAGEPVPEIDRRALEKMRKFEWPGNVRELKNFLARARVECPGRITVASVDAARRDPKTSTFFPRNLLVDDPLPALQERLERDYILYHLRRLDGDTRALSRFLGLSRRQFYRRCARHGIRLREL
jgi:DNA-binding NtrC family response regulator